MLPFIYGIQTMFPQQGKDYDILLIMIVLERVIIINE